MMTTSLAWLSPDMRVHGPPVSGVVFDHHSNWYNHSDLLPTQARSNATRRGGILQWKVLNNRGHREKEQRSPGCPGFLNFLIVR